MSELKHTEGPWHLGHVTIGATTPDPEGGFVEAGACDIRLYGPNAPASARLVAEAPALLAKLKSMTLLFRSALLMTSAEIAKDGMAFVREAEAVIAKAEGR